MMRLGPVPAVQREGHVTAHGANEAEAACECGQPPRAAGVCDAQIHSLLQARRTRASDFADGFEHGASNWDHHDSARGVGQHLAKCYKNIVKEGSWTAPWRERR